jgi:phosphoribosyl-AMP cyclohydrolase/RimJ/RimL family protein N-acetyltransferase
MIPLPRRPIQTERLVLEPAGPPHAPALYRAIEASREHLSRWLPWAKAGDFEHVLKHLSGLEAGWLDGSAYGFAIIAGGAAAGLVTLRRTPNLPFEANAGYWIRADVAGRGYMTEAAAAAVELGFRAAGLERIEVRADVDNRASWRVAERLGMRREGRLRGGAGAGDAYLYGMLAGDPRQDARTGDDSRPEGAPEVTEPDFSRGLVTAVAQDELDGAVLMVAHMNQEAYDRTRKTGRAWFWSRSRERLWEKGEASGNHLEVRSVTLDCDGDAVLLRVAPAGPACHTGARTCFHNPV